MESYYFIYDILAYLNSFLLIVYSVLGIIYIKNGKNEVLKLVAFYLIFSCLFDSVVRILILIAKLEINDNTIYIDIIYRLCELFIIGYIVNKYWLKSKIVWFLIGSNGMFLLYELFSYNTNGVINYTANAQITANILLVCLMSANLLKQLKQNKLFNVTNQMLCMLFLAYFSIHLIYKIVQNFIINQSYSNKSFVIFYSSYAVLHIVYYFSLSYILFRKNKKEIGHT